MSKFSELIEDKPIKMSVIFFWLWIDCLRSTDFEQRIADERGSEKFVQDQNEWKGIWLFGIDWKWSFSSGKYFTKPQGME